ncbi:hypothetical protein D3C81_1323140 [compost metagenome]
MAQITDCRLVLCKGLIERKLFLAHAIRRASIIDFLGQLDQLFDHLDGGQGAVLVAGDCILQAFGEFLALHRVAKPTRLDLVCKQAFQ